MSITAGGFHEKFEKKWHDSIVFLDNGRSLQNMGIKAVIFSWKIVKKGILLTFFAHNIV